MKLRKINKKGIDLTVSKLMSVILLAVFLSLVIYGVVTGALNPLFQKAKVMFDGVLVLFGTQKPENLSYSVDIPELGKGTITVFANKGFRECKISTNFGDYVIQEGKLKKYIDKKWTDDYPYSFECTSVKLNDLIFYNYFLSRGREIFEEKLDIRGGGIAKLSRLYGSQVFINIYNEPRGLDDTKINLYWDGNWYKNSLLYEGSESSLFDEFFSIASTGFYDEVYYAWTGMAGAEGAGKLVGGDNVLSSKEQLIFREKVSEAEKNLQFSSLQNIYEKASPRLSGSFFTDNKEYILSAERKDPILIVFTNKNNLDEKYALRISKDSAGGYELLVYKNGVWKLAANNICYATGSRENPDYVRDTYKRSQIFSTLNKECAKYL